MIQILVTGWEEKMSKLKKYSQIEAENLLSYKNGSLQIQMLCVSLNQKNTKNPHKDIA